MSDKAGKNPIKETHKKDEHSGDKKHGDHVKDKKGAAQDKHVDITKATAENLKDDTNALDKKQKKEGLSTNIETSEKAQTELHINKPATDIKDKLADTHDKAKDVKHDIKDKLKEAGKEVTVAYSHVVEVIQHTQIVVATITKAVAQIAWAKQRQDQIGAVRHTPYRQRLAEVEAVVIENNVADFVLSKAKVTNKDVTFDELMGAAAAQA